MLFQHVNMQYYACVNLIPVQGGGGEVEIIPLPTNEPRIKVKIRYRGFQAGKRYMKRASYKAIVDRTEYDSKLVLLI